LSTFASLIVSYTELMFLALRIVAFWYIKFWK